MVSQLPPWASLPTQPQTDYGWLSAQAPLPVNPMPYPSPMGAGQFNPFMQPSGAMPGAMPPYGSYAFTQPPGGMPAAVPQYNPYAFTQDPSATAAAPLHNPYAFAHSSSALPSAAGMQPPPAQSAWLTPQRPTWAPPITLMERTGIQAVVDKVNSMSVVKGAKELWNGEWA
jgi:hypothetical protein